MVALSSLTRSLPSQHMGQCTQKCTFRCHHPACSGPLEGLQCKTRYIHFVKFSGQATQTVAFMAFCIETQTLKGISIAIHLILTGEILPTSAGQCEQAFSAEKRTRVNLAFIAFCIGALHMYREPLVSAAFYCVAFACRLTLCTLQHSIYAYILS